MKIAYLIKSNLSRDKHLIQKICRQVTLWSELNIKNDVRIFCLYEDQILLPTALDQLQTSYFNVGKNNFFELFYILPKYRQVLKELKAFNPNLVYTRSWTPRVFTTKLSKLFNVVSEVNTIELSEYKLLSYNSIQGRLKYIYYNIFQNQFYNNLKAVCCLTNEIMDGFEGKNLLKIVIPNSLPLNEFPSSVPQNNKLPKIFFIGSPNMPWQGIDLIVKLAEATIDDLEFHIVGYEELNNVLLPSNVRNYGFLTYDEYQGVLVECDLGLGTMALGRKNMREACPLKVREYLAHGLPVILPYLDTAFLKEQPSWVYMFENVERDQIRTSTVDDIVLFCQKLQGTRLRLEDIKPFIDADYWEEKRLIFFNEVYQLNEKKE